MRPGDLQLYLLSLKETSTWVFLVTDPKWYFYCSIGMESNILITN